jgi:putative selenate reductase molybdopterin-binding subunit
VARRLLDSAPPGGHYAQARIAEQTGGGYTLRVGTAEFGKGTATVHRQLTARVLDVGVADIELLQSAPDPAVRRCPDTEPRLWPTRSAMPPAIG